MKQKNKTKVTKPYIIAAVFLVVLSLIVIGVALGIHATFQRDYEFYRNGEKVQGTVVSYTYDGSVRAGEKYNPAVHLRIVYVDENGIEYSLTVRARDLERLSEEEVKQEIGTTRPLIIDGSGNAISGDKDEQYYINALRNTIIILIAIAVFLALNLAWLIYSLVMAYKNKSTV